MIVIFTWLSTAAGSPNPVVIPAAAQGQRKLEIVPPLGHAWTLFDAFSKNSVGRSTDQTQPIERTQNRSPFVAGETVAATNLDTGSGTFTGILT